VLRPNRLKENVKKLMFAYSLNRGQMKKIFGSGIFEIIDNSKHIKYKKTLKKLTEYFNLSIDNLLYKEIINTSLNRRYFL
jgi:hypothetical protein